MMTNKSKKIKKLTNDKFVGNHAEMTEFVFGWCAFMQTKINEIIERLNEK